MHHDSRTDSLRVNGDRMKTIRWILQVQADLMNVKMESSARTKAPSRPLTVHDFGFPAEETTETAIHEGQLPSIKMTKETIQQRSPMKPGATMHDPS